MAATKKKKELTPREQRLAIAEAAKKASPEAEEKYKREDFRKYFVQLKRKLGLEPELENIIWLHFKAAGFDEKEKFDDGIRHFGYKL